MSRSGSAITVATRLRAHAAEVERCVGRGAMGLTADGLVVGVHVVPGESARGGGPSVVLVEGPLAEEHDELAAKQIEIHATQRRHGRRAVAIDAREPAHVKKRVAFLWCGGRSCCGRA